VRIIVYNAVGQVVKVLVKEQKCAGAYQAVWDGRNGLGQEVRSGIYFVRLEAGSYSKTRKVVLIR
jgi:flagellar hook assembly protein FlgD